MSDKVNNGIFFMFFILYKFAIQKCFYKEKFFCKKCIKKVFTYAIGMHMPDEAEIQYQSFSPGHQ